MADEIVVDVRWVDAGIAMVPRAAMTHQLFERLIRQLAEFRRYQPMMQAVMRTFCLCPLV